MHNFSEHFEVREVGAPVAAGATIDDNSDRIDMSLYDSVTFLVPITGSVSTGVATATVESNDADADAGMAAVTGAVATVTSAGANDIAGQLLQVEIARPAKRFVQLVRTSSVANITYGTVIAILKPRRRPVTRHATVSAATRVSD
jgi:hypothetical protein